MIAAVCLGLAIGTLLGLLGGGGSILAVPALVYGIGQTPHQAVVSSLIVVGVAAAAGAAPRIRARMIHWRLVAVFAPTGAAAAFGGAEVNALLPGRVELAGFALVMIAAGIRMLRKNDVAGTACAGPTGTVNWRRCLPRAAAAGLAVGFLTGLFGVGGGFLVVPALVLALSLEMAVAVGTSLVIVAVNSASGLVAHAHTHIDVPITAAFTMAAVAGAVAAERFAHHVPADRLQRWFAYLVFAVASFVLIQVGIRGTA